MVGLNNFLNHPYLKSLTTIVAPKIYVLYVDMLPSYLLIDFLPLNYFFKY